MSARPALQLALDEPDLAVALDVAERAAPHLDVVEAGTILCLSQGIGAIAALRGVWGERPIVADLRIVEAGAIIADLAFVAGADAVTVFGGTSDVAIGAVRERAGAAGRRMQVEVFEAWSPAAARRWRELGVEELILHRSRDGERTGGRAWGRADLDRVAEAADLGFAVSVTGGVGPDDIATFAGLPVACFVIGRGIAAAADPGAAARSYQAAIEAAFGAP